MTTSRIQRLAVLVIIACTYAVLPAIGGGIMSFSANGDFPVLADTLTVSTIIREQVAVTTVKQVFHNALIRPGTPLYGVTLPSDAMVTSMRWKIKDTWFKASMTSSDTSTSLDQSSTAPSTFSKWFTGAPFTFSIKDTILPAEFVTIELTYVELLKYKNGRIPYAYRPTTLNGAANILIDEWSIDVESGRTISNVVVSPTLSDTLEQIATRCRMYGKDVSIQGNVFTITFGLEFDALSMNVLSTKPAGEDGYALMLAVPKTVGDDSDVMPKRVTFVIDRSGSMDADDRLESAVEAATYCINNLDPSDIFNVVPFDEYVTQWRPDHVPANATNTRAAIDYLKSLYFASGTNIMLALTQSLKMHKADQYVNVIIFLTDGQATIQNEILNAANTSSTRIFVFGIGNGVNQTALQRIANENNGAWFYLERSKSIASTVSEFYDYIKDPVIKNPTISVGPNVMYDVYPSVIPDIYKGQQLVLAGRYTTPGDVTVTVNGTNREGAVSYPFAARLTDDPNINVFVAKIWAKYRIDMLVEWMKKEQANSSKYKEWREEVIRLGKKYSIVTPFTSFADTGTQDNSGGTTSVTNDYVSETWSRCSVAPNPVRDRTRITIDLRDTERRHVSVEIYDMYGNLVYILYNGEMAPELLYFDWDTRDVSGTLVAAGVYQLSVTVNGQHSGSNINVVR